MNTNDITWFVVVNPHAGSGKTLMQWAKAEVLLQSKGVKFISAMTGGGYNIMTLTEKAATEGHRNFIAVGGDGTVHDALAGIMSFVDKHSASLKDFTIGVIPIGSGNDWIRSHGIPHDLDLITDLIAQGSFTRQDIVRASVWNGKPMEGEAVNYSYMLNVGGVAFDAKICERVNWQKQQGLKGKVLYVKALVYMLFRSRFYGMTVDFDGERVFDGKMFSCAFGVGKYSGGGMRQTPDAVLDDGKVDVTLIPSRVFPWIVFHVYKLFTAKFLTVPRLVSGKVKEAVLLPKDYGCSPIVEVDGEVVGSLPMKVEVLPEQVRVLHRKSKK